MVSRFVTSAPVKQDGLCLLPPPPHYRMMAPQRSDAFSVTNPAGSYVPQAQGPGQGQALRGLPPTVPPSQSSTPPNTDIKVPNIPNQMGPMFVQPSVRQTPNQYYSPRGTAGPPNQPPRMPNQQHRPQTQTPVYQPQYIIPSQMFLPNVAYYNTQAQRPANMINAPYVFGSQQLTYQYTTPQPPSVSTYPLFYTQQQMIPRNPMPQATSAPPNPPQGPIQQPAALQAPPPPASFSRSNQRIKRPHALAIIDPTTGEDKMNEIFDDNSHPPSGESSARQTPQPSRPKKEVQAEFAKQVAQAISADQHQMAPDEPILQDPSYLEQYPPPPQPTQVLQNQKYDTNSSNLHINAKEFVSNSNKTAKEITPIVSANSLSAEVVLHKKDKESPVKSRKRDYKTDIPKEPQHKESNTCEPINNLVKEENVGDIHNASCASLNSVTAVTQPFKDDPAECDKKYSKKGQPEKVNEGDTTSVQSPQEVVNNGKYKKNEQRHSKQNSSQPSANHQQQQQAKQPPSVQVPPPQPPKANNKSNKKSELNLKGANKEGTDMDAFNDNGSKNEVNANVVISSQSDIVNANTITSQTQIPPEPSPVAENEDTKVSSSSDRKGAEENDNVIKPEPVVVNNMPPPPEVGAVVPAPALPKQAKPQFDVTSIIKETPKTIMQINNTQDETDRGYFSNDKIVLAKNDANINKNNYNDVKPQLPYREGQWSPACRDGKKVYERDFLLALQNFPASKIKPGNIPDVVLADERSRPIDGRMSMGGRTDFTTPPFQNYGSKSGSQRGVLPKQRNSQSKMGSRSGNDKSAKPTPKVSISLKGDVKLHETENAWKPTRFAKSEEISEDEKKTEKLYKKVRSVLNKLTPQKFDTLVAQVRALEIDTKEKLNRVIDLVFDKAIDEPNFSVAYARMCNELQIMSVSGSEDKKGTFKTLLITRCQKEFEKQSIDETERANRVKIIDECTDPEKKKELTFDLEEYDRRLRMKSVGTIRFIGELFKQQMLTTNIMKRCLQTLLDNNDEESLECLCKLLTTIGKELESKKVDMKSIFDEMKKIVDNRQQKVSSRIRFMLQDVIELRDSNWVSRRGDSNPKTIDQIQKEAENEQFNIQVMNANIPRKDDRSSSGGGPRQTASRKNPSEDGWNSVSSRNNRQSYTIQMEKLKNKIPQSDEPLGSSQSFATWSKGAMGSKNQSQATLPTNLNLYTALENIDPERRPINQRSNKDPYTSKGPSLERNSYKTSYDGRGSRSGSQHRTENTAALRPSHTPPTLAPSKPSTPAPIPAADWDQILRRIHDSLNEYLNSYCTADEYFQEIATIPSSKYSNVVFESYNHITEKSQKDRLKTGELFATLITSGKLSLDDFCSGLEEFLALGEDLEIDIPKIWTYNAENIVHLVYQQVLPFTRMHTVLKVVIDNNKAANILKPLFDLVICEKGPNFLQHIWQKSNLQLSDFIPSSEVPLFVKNNNLEFLVGGDSPVGHCELTYEQIRSKLSEFLQNGTCFDDIVNWISANVGERVKENKFIRVLATAIFENSIQKNKLVADVLQRHTKLIHKYVDNNSNLELQCLYALQELVRKLEYPQGLLLSICDKLYEESTFCQESFILWEGSDDPAEQGGKGVCLKQLTSFFTSLKENEEEGEYSSNSEDP
ncbi:eukaryotic translation initiation factor 4 gamma 1 isoform X2 [Cylas formicarius]|uniref:eukaryotic translation initiation factor 4 gamma 1 isoform X2 n=1 Tax=Cylas formicarius TaxID=197179 RepID=UPI002958934B|nr:eukaryotic translation initiation factor 4 gamma 1 isoform X2 [Cylas formicarius]